MWYILFNCRIDGTSASGIGRLINDAQEGDAMCNCRMKRLVVKDMPCLVLFASRDIQMGEELRYSYGDDSDFPWRKVCSPILVSHKIKNSLGILFSTRTICPD